MKVWGPICNKQVKFNEFVLPFFPKHISIVSVLYNDQEVPKRNYSYDTR